ncbi:MAG: VWA domain-containing protein, partial [Terriglobales bacterium]
PYTLTPVIVADANTVPVTVVVRDRNGKVIQGLDEKSFRVSDNGRPQTIASFQMVTAPARSAAQSTGAVQPSTASAAAPQAQAARRYVALVFDDVNSDKNDLAEARNAARRFFREQLGPADRMAVFTISNSQSLDFTSNREALASTIMQIAPHPRQSAAGIATCPRMSGYDAYLIAVVHDQGALLAKNSEAAACRGGGGGRDTSLVQQQQLNACGLKCTFGLPPPMGSDGVPVDVMAEATWEMTRGIAEDTLAAVRDVVDYTAKQPGQRIVVLASSGFFSETLDEQKDQIVRDALRAGVVINALDAKGLYADELDPPLSEQSDEGVLPLASFEFEEAAKFPMRGAQADAMASFAEATGGLYFQNNNDLTLGFERLGLAPEAGFELAFTPTPLIRDGKLHALKIELAPTISGATIEARRGYFAPPPGPTAAELEHSMYLAMRDTAASSAVPAEVEASAKPGTLAVRVHVGVTQPKEDVAIVAGLFDGSGRFVTGEQGDLDLALKEATFKSLRKKGLAPSFELRAPAGPYRLRVVVQDKISGAESAFNQAVEVR